MVSHCPNNVLWCNIPGVPAVQWCPSYSMVSLISLVSLPSVVSRPPIVASICCTPAAPTPLGPLGARLPIKNEGKRKKADVKKDKCSHKTSKSLQPSRQQRYCLDPGLNCAFERTFHFFAQSKIRQQKQLQCQAF